MRTVFRLFLLSVIVAAVATTKDFGMVAAKAILNGF